MGMYHNRPHVEDIRKMKRNGQKISMLFVSTPDEAAAAAAAGNLKRVVLECGGKNPAVVLEDAEDLDLVAEQVVNGAFWNMGENCSATSRLIVHASIKNELLQRIGAYMREWKTGDPLDPENRIGALVSKSHFEKVKSFLTDVKTEKLSVAHGGATHMVALREGQSATISKD